MVVEMDYGFIIFIGVKFSFYKYYKYDSLIYSILFILIFMPDLSFDYLWCNNFSSVIFLINI